MTRESQDLSAPVTAGPRIVAPGLPALRASIDRIDRATADLLVRRARMARRVALLKQLLHLPNRDHGREREVREHYASILRRAGWSERSLDSWLETMLSASRDLQAQISVAIQGSPGSWSELSLQRTLPDIRIVHCETVEAAWRLARKGEADAAWLAARNSTIGDVAATAAVRRDAECWAEADQPVTHALLAPPGTRLPDVRRVEAHPLAIEQCRKTLDRLLPHAQRVDALDGAHAARTLAERPATAVLASAHLAPLLQLAVLHERVNDLAQNETTFQLLLPKEIF